LDYSGAKGREIERRLSSKTKAILPVDFAGYPADLDEIKTLAREKKLVVIEDACHALGAEYRGTKIGGLSDMTILSFHPVKHITTGEGGMVLTNAEEFYERLRVFRHHGIVKNNFDQSSWYYEIYAPGHNFRLTDFQCALGISQLKKLDRFVERRREIAARYNEAFAQIDELIRPTELAHVKAAYHIYIIQLRTEKLNVGRKEIFEALRAENIGVNVHYIPLHLQPFYEKEFEYKRGDYPKAERYYERAITLPIFPKMSDEDVQDVIEAVQKVIQYYRK
jgi:perosamine synthetase